MAFTHLHFHTSYSFLDGYNPIPKAVARVKELGMTACAITDHNHVGGVPEFKEECEKQGIKPLLGVELYFTPDMTQISKSLDDRKKDAKERAIKAGVITEDQTFKTKKELNELIEPYMYDTRSYHILFIAKNQTGWNNLVKIESEAAKNGFFNARNHCDMNLLRKYHEGIICTNACIGSYSARQICKGNRETAEQYIIDMKEIFGDDFYLEIQPLQLDKQTITNQFYIEMSKKHNIKIVATNDVHWTNKEDYEDHDVLLCVGMKRFKDETNRMRYDNDFWIKSEDEMKESFAAQTAKLCDNNTEYYNICLEAIERTQEIVDKVDTNIKLGSDVPLFSNVKIPIDATPEEYLEYLAWTGLYKYLNKHPELDRKKYEKQLAFELSIISTKGYAPYFLAVEEYVTWANNNDCPTGPGRGSAAGSLVLFAIGVTKVIDPLEHHLLFSRFLTADRNSPPDVDIDFSYTNRDSVVHHLEQYYGNKYVSHIGTYTYMKVKNGLKDVARVLRLPFADANLITKKIDEFSDDPNITFKKLDALANGTDEEKKSYTEFKKLEAKYLEIFRLARAFEDTPRGYGVHASGILVTPMPVSDLFPLRYDDAGTAITLYTGTQLEIYGAIDQR